MDAFSGVLCLVHNRKMVFRSSVKHFNAGAVSFDFELIGTCGCNLKFTTSMLNEKESDMMETSLREMANGST